MSVYYDQTSFIVYVKYSFTKYFTYGRKGLTPVLSFFRNINRLVSLIPLYLVALGVMLTIFKVYILKDRLLYVAFMSLGKCRVGLHA